ALRDVAEVLWTGVWTYQEESSADSGDTLLVEDIVSAFYSQDRRDQQPCLIGSEISYVTAAQEVRVVPAGLQLVVTDEAAHLALPGRLQAQQFVGNEAGLGIATNQQHDLLTPRRE